MYISPMIGPFTKPCGRRDCPNIITATAYRLKFRVYCSTSCATRQRMANGWTPHAFLTAENRTRGARLGGKVSGEARHRRSLAKAVTMCADLLPAEWLASYGAADLARIKVLLGRAYLVGQGRERQRVDSARRYEQTKAKRQRKAA